jgi:TRAP-type C4-dicarboxylate transport system substrate-binding protein
MAKFEEPFEDTQSIFNQVIDVAGLSQLINITVLSNNKAKEIFKIYKSNELLKYRTGDDVIIVINEKIFEKLNPQQKMIVAEEAVAYISYDSENEKLVITQPDFMAHTGVLRKHTYPVIEVVRESIKTLYQSEKQSEEETKAATEKAKKQKSY